MFSGLLHKFSCCKNYVDASSALSEPTLQLWQDVLSDGLQLLLYDSSKDLID